MYITPVYAALLGLLFVYLSARTILLRRKLKIAVGDAGNRDMLRAMRVHANFAEYTPLALLLIFMLELQNGYGLLVHALSVVLISGRIFHANGVSQSNENFRYRVFGMMLTFTSLTGAALSILLVNFLANFRSFPL